MQRLSPAERETPPLAPEIVIEIRSPDDRSADVDHQRDVYLAASAMAVLIVDPDRRRMDAFNNKLNMPHKVREALELLRRDGWVIVKASDRYRTGRG